MSCILHVNEIAERVQTEEGRKMFIVKFNSLKYIMVSEQHIMWGVKLSKKYYYSPSSNKSTCLYRFPTKACTCAQGYFALVNCLHALSCRTRPYTSGLPGTRLTLGATESWEFSVSRPPGLMLQWLCSVLLFFQTT